MLLAAERLAEAALGARMARLRADWRALGATADGCAERRKRANDVARLVGALARLSKTTAKLAADEHAIRAAMDDALRTRGPIERSKTEAEAMQATPLPKTRPSGKARPAAPRKRARPTRATPARTPARAPP